MGCFSSKSNNLREADSDVSPQKAADRLKSYETREETADAEKTENDEINEKIPTAENATQEKGDEADATGLTISNAAAIGLIDAADAASAPVVVAAPPSAVEKPEPVAKIPEPEKSKSYSRYSASDSDDENPLAAAMSASIADLEQQKQSQKTSNTEKNEINLNDD